MRTVGCFTDGHGRAAPAACSGLTCAAEPGVHPVCPPGGPRDSPDGGGREGGCTDGWAGSGEGDACRAGGAGACRPRVSSLRYSAPGTRAEMWPSCWSARSSVILSGTPAGRSRGDGHGRGQGQGRRSCALRAVMRKAAGGFSSLRASRPGGLAAARPADGDLVRTVAPLLMSPPGDWPQVYLACTSDGRGRRRRPAVAQVADSDCWARYIAGISEDHGIGMVVGLPGRQPLAAPRAPGRSCEECLIRQQVVRSLPAFGASQVAGGQGTGGGSKLTIFPPPPRSPPGRPVRRRCPR